MCEYWVYLNENYWSNVNDILTWLKSKYILNKQESSSTQMVFYDKLNRMKIVLMHLALFLIPIVSKVHLLQQVLRIMLLE